MDTRIIDREIIKRIITYCGKRTMEWIQPNKDGITWDRYALPPNGDKSRAIMWNYGLEDHEVQRIISKPSNQQVSILIY